MVSLHPVSIKPVNNMLLKYNDREQTSLIKVKFIAKFEYNSGV